MSENNVISLYIVLGLLFAPLAGAVAFVITYEEYAHHQMEKRRLIRASLEAAVVSFVAIVALLLFAGYLLGKSGT